MFGHHHPAQMDLLREAAIGSNVQIIDEVYDADEVLSLTDVCDAYVSLHRSEGLGLTMAEAMLMGKPVIATNYSGNVDFMNTSNSLLVPFELVKLGRQLPPYDADLMWAEPSIEHAAALMRRIVDEPVWARELGARAKVSAETALSVEAAARKVEQRLAEIRALRISVPDERA
jgi:glycosyltransferase involved in cell wall biosynthesis